MDPARNDRALTRNELARLVAYADSCARSDVECCCQMVCPEQITDPLERLRAAWYDLRTIEEDDTVTPEAVWWLRLRGLFVVHPDNPHLVRFTPLERQKHWQTFDLVAHLHRQREFSLRTFGPGPHRGGPWATGIVDHIAKELEEVLERPEAVEEWIDVVILALDGAWRAGHSPEEIATALADKQARNEARRWPDWRTAEPGKAIEHIREDAE